MRPRRPSPEHEQAVARRLAALSAQWDAVRAEESQGGTTGPVGAVPPEPVAPPEVAVAPATADEWLWEPHTRVRDAVLAPVPSEPVPEPVPQSMPEPVAPVPVPVPVPADPGAVPTVVAEPVPVPGRHAARRPGATVLRLPQLPLDRVALRPAHLVWVGLFAATVLALSAWWVVQSRDVAVVTPVAAPATSTAASAAPQDSTAAATGLAPGGAAAGAPSQPAGEVVVDVTGKVRRPGIVVLPVGSRVADALEAAGGARRGVDLQPLNLARLLVDGEQIVVGTPAAAQVGPAGTGTGTGPGTGVPGVTPGGLVNLNVATQAELESLPGVGPVTAAAIVEWRTRHGGFSSVEDLLEVQGIGEVTLERLAPLVTV